MVRNFQTDWQVTDEDLKVFEDIVPGRVITNPEDIAPSNTDWTRFYRYTL